MITQRALDDLTARLMQEGWLRPNVRALLLWINPISRQDSPQELKRCLLTVVQTCRCNYCGCTNVRDVAETGRLGTKCVSCGGINVGDFYFYG